MEQIDVAKRKPRRTKGTPSYYYRNRFAAAVIAAGSTIFALWYKQIEPFSATPIFRKANEKLIHELLPVTEEEKDRKFIFNLHMSPRSSKAIEDTIEEGKQLLSDR